MKLKIALLTLVTPEIWKYGKYGLVTKRRYAERHGYDLFIYKDTLDANRPPAWSKLKIIQKHLSDYSWVFWTDADSLIMNYEITLESLINEALGKDMILTKGPIGKYNTGEWLIRNSTWSKDIIEKTWSNVSDDDFWLKRNPWEQQAFINLSNSMADFDDHIQVTSLRSLNSRPSKRYLDSFLDLEDSIYEEGDFLIHFYHTKSFELRCEGMQRYARESFRKRK